MNLLRNIQAVAFLLILCSTHLRSVRRCWTPFLIEAHLWFLPLLLLVLESMLPIFSLSLFMVGVITYISWCKNLVMLEEIECMCTLFSYMTKLCMIESSAAYLKTVMLALLLMKFSMFASSATGTCNCELICSKFDTFDISGHANLCTVCSYMTVVAQNSYIQWLPLG